MFSNTFVCEAPLRVFVSHRSLPIWLKSIESTLAFLHGHLEAVPKKMHELVGLLWCCKSPHRSNCGKIMLLVRKYGVCMYFWSWHNKVKKVFSQLWTEYLMSYLCRSTSTLLNLSVEKLVWVLDECSGTYVGIFLNPVDLLDAFQWVFKLVYSILQVECNFPSKIWSTWQLVKETTPSFYVCKYNSFKGAVWCLYAPPFY